MFQIIVTEASKSIQDVNRSWKPPVQISEGETMVRMGSSTEDPTVLRSPSRSWKVIIKLLFLFLNLLIPIVSCHPKVNSSYRKLFKMPLL